MDIKKSKKSHFNSKKWSPTWGGLKQGVRGSIMIKVVNLVVPSPSLLACLPGVEYIKTSSLLAANLKNIAFHCNVEVDFNKTPESKYLIQSFPNSKLSIYRLNVKLFLPMLCPLVRRIRDDLPVSGCIGREIWFQSSLSN